MSFPLSLSKDLFSGSRNRYLWIIRIKNLSLKVVHRKSNVYYLHYILWSDIPQAHHFTLISVVLFTRRNDIFIFPSFLSTEIVHVTEIFRREKRAHLSLVQAMSVWYQHVTQAKSNLLLIRLLQTNSGKKSSKPQNIPPDEIHLKISSAKCQLFCADHEITIVDDYLQWTNPTLKQDGNRYEMWKRLKE